MGKGVRLISALQRGKVSVAKLLRWNGEELDRLLGVQMDRFHQRVAVGVYREDFMDVIDGNMPGNIVRMKRHHGNGFATLHPHDRRMVMTAMADYPCVMMFVPDPAARMANRPVPGLTGCHRLNIYHALLTSDRISREAIADSLRQTRKPVGLNTCADSLIGTRSSRLSR